MTDDLKLGATGEFPQDKLNETDEGGLVIAVGVEDGKVVVRFGKEVAWIGLAPEGAFELAEALVKHGAAILEERHARKSS